MTRLKLPWRRPCLREKIVYRNDRGNELGIYVTCGFDPATFELVEVFARPRGNVDADRCREMDDAGVLMSRLLQFGDTIGEVCAGMGRLQNEPARAHSAIGAVADAARELAWAVESEWGPPPEEPRWRRRHAAPEPQPSQEREPPCPTPPEPPPTTPETPTPPPSG